MDLLRRSQHIAPMESRHSIMIHPFFMPGGSLALCLSNFFAFCCRRTVPNIKGFSLLCYASKKKCIPSDDVERKIAVTRYDIPERLLPD